MSKRDRIRLQQQIEEQNQQKLNPQSDLAEVEHVPPHPAHSPTQQILNMQRTQGNQAVRRYLSSIQRDILEDGGPLNEEVSSRINSKRGSGSTLDSTVQAEMSQKLGRDFSDVSVHRDSESDQLNQELGAKAFTTGRDIFFRGDSYNPGSSEGKSLIAHELTHVIQQDGSIPSGDLTLGPANDSYESQADQMASQVTSTSSGVQMKQDDSIQRQEEEEELQMKRDDSIQRQEEEEELQMKRDDAIQRQEEEEELQA